MFRDFGQEQISSGSHLEKFGLLEDGIGKDMISDFTTTLIKSFLCEYTEIFAQKEIANPLRRRVTVQKAVFNYDTRSWESRQYDLPFYNRDYVLLTPRDMLTRDENWINRPEMLDQFETLQNALPNDQLRAEISQYLLRVMPPDPTRKELRRLFGDAVRQFPEVLDHYISRKERNGNQAAAASVEKVKQTYGLFVEQVRQFVTSELVPAGFYTNFGDSQRACEKRISILSAAFGEGGARPYFCRDGKPIGNQDELLLILRMLWLATPDGGELPKSHSESFGLVTARLGSNKQLSRSLSSYCRKARDGNRLAIFSFSDSDYTSTNAVLKSEDLNFRPDIVHIDARSDQKKEAKKSRFRVALSFPGEHRGFVLEVADALASKLTRESVFYDEWYEVELLGVGGDLKLESMYQQADLVVPFFSEHYKKPWCSMEWETIRGILLNRKRDDLVIPVHLDDTEIPGWSAVNFGIQLKGRTAQQIAEIILQALDNRVRPRNGVKAHPEVTDSPGDKSVEASKQVMAIWSEKLDYLRQQEAIASDPAQKFALKKQIEEAAERIREFGG
ncbi:MAG: hypothetical protein ACI8UO_005659 [Verrucomicrobiales bacterium]